MPDQLNLVRELQRKLIHLATASLPLAYYAGVSKQIILYISFTLAIGFLTADLLRMNFTLARNYFLRVFSHLIREPEQRKLTGATWLFIAMAASFYLYPKPAAVASVLFVCLADPVAALSGRRFGREKIFDKTLEGSFGFYLTAAAVILVFTDFSWMGLGVAIGATLIELLPLGINDNLTIPIISGYLLTALG